MQIATVLVQNWKF